MPEINEQYDLRTRLVLAIVNELREDDQFALIGIGERELRITWERDGSRTQSRKRNEQYEMSKKKLRRQVADLTARMEARERGARNLLESLECTDAHLRDLTDRVAALEVMG